jgi:hypothetical protein
MTELAELYAAVVDARIWREVASRAMHNVEAQANHERDPDGSLPVIDATIPGNEERARTIAEIQVQLDALAQDLAHANASYDRAISDYGNAAAAAPLFEPGNTDPILLLPVRIEAVYRARELLIRVYPDDVHVDSHEPALTPGERDAGMAYWRSVFEGAGAPDIRLSAWRALAGAVGPNRAGWVREALAPSNQWPEEPNFPNVELRPEAWTRAAHTVLLPDRFEFSAYRDGQLVWRLEGTPVPDTLPVGLAPPTSREQVAESDDLPWDAGSRWLVDFDLAVGAGMAIRAPLSEPGEKFDLLTVIGTGIQPAEEGAARVQGLLGAHARTTGLSSLPIGTPTNNTPGSRSGWHSGAAPPDPDTTTGWQSAYDPSSTEDAARLARALGVDGRAVLAAVCEPGRDDEPLLRDLHRLFADYLAWSWLFQPDGLGPGEHAPCAEEWYATVAEYFVSFVRGRGPLPALRIGRQPYGILPVSSVDLWRGQDVPEMIATHVSSFHAMFAEHADRAVQIGEGEDQDSVLLDLLSREPSPRRTAIRSNGDQGPRDQAPLPAEVGSVPAAARLARLSGDFTRTEYDPFPADLTDELAATIASRPLAALLAVLDEQMPHLTADPFAIPDEELFARVNPLLISIRQLIYAPTLSYFYRQAEWAANALFISVSFTGKFAREGAAPEVIGVQQRSAARYHELFTKYVALEEHAVANLSRFETLYRETFEPLSHRVDAWVTSLATARLAGLRQQRPTGIRTGAYGWLTAIDPSFPVAPHEGFVLTPSMHHATTTAVLRSGYQAHSDKRAFAVDIQSARVRRAEAVIAGVRAGQPLSALLGYQVERALHDAHLDSLISALRQAFPLAPLVQPDDNGEQAKIAIGARNVVDGQALRAHVTTAADPLQLSDNSILVLSAEDSATVLRIFGELEETFDAAADLMLAESVHHLVGGNALRAGIAADAAGRGQDLPSEFDVVRTPRSGAALTYHVGILLPGAQHGGWADDRPLARLEPGLEAWLRLRLGPAPAELASWCALDLLVAPAEKVRALGDFDDLLALCERLRAPLATASPLSPEQLGGGGWDVVELHKRVDDWLSAVNGAGQDVAKLAALGIPVRTGETAEDRARLAELLDDPDRTMLAGPPGDPAQHADWVAGVLAMTSRLLHPSVKLAPLLTGRLPAAPAGADEETVAAWLRDVALVRSKVDDLDGALVAAEVVAGTGAPRFVVAQRSASPWIATAVPAPDARDSLVLHQDELAPVRGLVVDSWSEVVPGTGESGAEEIAGVAFDYDRPGARAPQAMVLAVPPDPARGWSREDVHACVAETLRLARLRTLDLQDLPEIRMSLPIPDGTS